MCVCVRVCVGWVGGKVEERQQDKCEGTASHRGRRGKSNSTGARPVCEPLCVSTLEADSGFILASFFSEERASSERRASITLWFTRLRSDLVFKVGRAEVPGLFLNDAIHRDTHSPTFSRRNLMM